MSPATEPSIPLIDAQPMHSIFPVVAEWWQFRIWIAVRKKLFSLRTTGLDVFFEVGSRAGKRKQEPQNSANCGMMPVPRLEVSRLKLFLAQIERLLDLDHLMRIPATKNRLATACSCRTD